MQVGDFLAKVAGIDVSVDKAKCMSTLAANKGKSTQELLAEMYADADEDGKASLAAAWEAGRSKREGNGPPPSE